MERDGHVAIAAGGQDRRSRVVTMTASGRHVWQDLALPKVHAYYEEILDAMAARALLVRQEHLLKLAVDLQGANGEGALKFGIRADLFERRLGRRVSRLITFSAASRVPVKRRPALITHCSR